MAKAPRLGQHAKYNYILQQKFYNTSIKPILGTYANHQELVILRDTDIIDQLNALLQDIDHTRNPKFKGSFVGLSDWGLLTRDMRPVDSSESLLVEFKPKWLAQSPSAPPDAIRCRQCAVELQRLLTRPPGKRPRLENKPCPLALMDPDAPEPVGSPFRIAPHLRGVPDEGYFEGILRDICRHPLLQTLREQQQRHDPNGPLDAHVDDYAFGVAMTIRDCTCFVQIPRSREKSESHEEPLILRLADLDWKDPDTKVHTWRSTEQRLVEGGYYTAKWIVCNGAYYRPPTLCLLESAPQRARAEDIIRLQDEEGSSTEAHVYVQKADTKAFEQILAPFRRDGNQ